MKTFAVLLLTLTTFQSLAWNDKIPARFKRLPEICQLQTDFAANFFEAHTFNVETMNSLNAKLMQVLQDYIADDSMTTLAQIKEEYSDLYITLLKHRVSGKQYVYVNGYPGDNETGLYFDAETFEVMGDNGDGDIAIHTNQGTIPCYDLIED